MNVTDFTFLLSSPDAINHRQTLTLQKIADEFPYLQSARALYLKGLYNENSFRYNQELKITAAHTTDRSVLFDFITSDKFTSIQRELYERKIEALHQIVVTGIEIVTADRSEVKTAVEQSVLNSIREAGIAEEVSVETAIEMASDEIATPTPEQKLELGRPLEFSRDEKHSFQEWLQLSQISPIERDLAADSVSQMQTETESESEIDLKQKKIELIDKFIEANPKIPPIRPDATKPIFVEPVKPDNTYLMTETLARVYLEQKKYQKAIQAYQILILKYPEKSSFFADRILDIKNLQQNNK